MNRRQLFRGAVAMAIAMPFAPLIPKFVAAAAPVGGVLDEATVQSLYDNLPFAYRIEWPIGLALWNDKAVARFGTFEFDKL